MVCSKSFAEWMPVSTNHYGAYFVDLSLIKEENGYIYYWDLGNLNSPIGEKILSVKTFNKGDCNLFLRKTLKNVFFEQAMGIGKGKIDIIKNKKWNKPPIKSSNEKILETVCNYMR